MLITNSVKNYIIFLIVGGNFHMYNILNYETIKKIKEKTQGRLG